VLTCHPRGLEGVQKCPVVRQRDRDQGAPLEMYGNLCPFGRMMWRYTSADGHDYDVDQ